MNMNKQYRQVTLGTEGEGQERGQKRRDRKKSQEAVTCDREDDDGRYVRPRIFSPGRSRRSIRIVGHSSPDPPLSFQQRYLENFMLDGTPCGEHLSELRFLPWQELTFQQVETARKAWDKVPQASESTLNQYWAAPQPPKEMSHIPDVTQLPKAAPIWGRAYLCVVRLTAAVVNSFQGSEGAPSTRDTYYRLLDMLMIKDCAHHLKGFPGLESEKAFTAWLDWYCAELPRFMIAPCWSLWTTPDGELRIRVLQAESYWRYETSATRTLDMWLGYSK
jgi:hypothetical protein